MKAIETKTMGNPMSSTSLEVRLFYNMYSQQYNCVYFKLAVTYCYDIYGFTAINTYIRTALFQIMAQAFICL